MSRHLVMSASVDIELPEELNDLSPTKLAALALGITVEWSGYPDGSVIKTAGPSVGAASRRHNGSYPEAGWQT